MESSSRESSETGFYREDPGKQLSDWLQLSRLPYLGKLGWLLAVLQLPFLRFLRIDSGLGFRLPRH